MKGVNREVAEAAKKVMKKLKEELEKNGLKLSVTERGKEGKNKMIASCGFLENEVSQFSKEEGVSLADSVETLGVDLRIRVKRLGAKKKSEKKKVQRKVLDYQVFRRASRRWRSRSCHVRVWCQQGLGEFMQW